MRLLSALQATPVSVALVDVRRRGAAAPSAGTSQRSAVWSLSSYAGCVTDTTTHLPSGLGTGAPTRGISQSASCVTGCLPCAEGHTVVLTINPATTSILVDMGTLLTGGIIAFGVPGSRFRVPGSGFRVPGSGVQGSRCCEPRTMEPLNLEPGTMEPGTLSISFHDFEQAGWERAAEYYGDAFGSLTAQTIKPLLEAAGVRSGTRVLDVATGPGTVAASAAALGARPVGIDFSPQMVTLAREQSPSLVFEEGDAEALEFADARFDAVTINFGVLHLARPDTALAEARRVLVPGGRCAFTVWGKPESSVGFGIVLGAIERFGRLDVPLPEGPPFFRFSDSDESIRSMMAVGFTDGSVDLVDIVWR